MTLTHPTRFKEILYDLDDFMKAVSDLERVRLSFFYRRQKDIITVQPRLFYPAGRILIWEGPSKTFFAVEYDAIAEFEKECLELVKSKLGFEPKRGRWE